MTILFWFACPKSSRIVPKKQFALPDRPFEYTAENPRLATSSIVFETLFIRQNGTHVAEAAASSLIAGFCCCVYPPTEYDLSVSLL
jgi:hypothetical protein